MTHVTRHVSKERIEWTARGRNPPTGFEAGGVSRVDHFATFCRHGCVRLLCRFHLCCCKAVGTVPTLTNQGGWVELALLRFAHNAVFYPVLFITGAENGVGEQRHFGRRDNP